MMRVTRAHFAVIGFVIAFVFQIATSDMTNIMGQIINKARETSDSDEDDFLDKLEAYFASELNLDVGFYIFTPRNPVEAYNLKPTRLSLQNSSFDPKLETKFIIHGYNTELPKESVFYDMKSEMLQEGSYNVIVTDWTKYNMGSYFGAIMNAVIVGIDISRLIEFLIKNSGITAGSVHIIGHSLGAQVAAFAGKTTPSLGRITGLDAAGPLFQLLPRSLRLRHTDATFVDAIHTNGALLTIEGSGVFFPYGDLDFFPNGGSTQPGCNFNDTFMYTEKTLDRVDSIVKKISCSHSRAPYLFLNSIRKCRFISVLCQDFLEVWLKDCTFQHAITAQMGFHAKPISTIAPKSAFFLETKGSPPYCMD